MTIWSAARHRRRSRVVLIDQPTTQRENRSHQHAQIQKTLRRSNVCDVTHPRLVWSLGLKAALQPIGGHGQRMPRVGGVPIATAVARMQTLLFHQLADPLWVGFYSARPQRRTHAGPAVATALC